MWERTTSGGAMVAGVVAAGLQAGTRGLHVGTRDEWRRDGGRHGGGRATRGNARATCGNGRRVAAGYKREREGYMWERATRGGRATSGNVMTTCGNGRWWWMGAMWFGDVL